MDEKTRSKNSLAVWAALQFPQYFGAAWPLTDGTGTTLKFDWLTAVEGRQYRVLWCAGTGGWLKYFYLTLPYYASEAAARAACPKYTYARGASHVSLNSGCWLDMTPDYNELNLLYHFAQSEKGPILPQSMGATWFGWTRFWERGDTIQLWVDGGGIHAAITCADGNGVGTARSIREVAVEYVYYHLPENT